MRPHLAAVDLFSGCAGASEGLKQAGFDICGALDIDPVACQTYSKNLGVEPIQADLRKIKGNEILETFDLKRGDVDLLVGCPPCQGFSSLRRTSLESPKDFGRDDRNDLVSVFVDRVKEIQPSVVLFENVPGIATAQTGRIFKSRFFEKYLKRMRGLGYEVVHRVVNAAEYGVPQFRRRLIAFGVRSGGDGLMFPEPMHCNPKQIEDEEKLPWNTVRQAIGDLPRLGSGEMHPSIPNHIARDHSPETLEVIRSVPKDGGSRRDLPRQLWLKCHKALKDWGAGSVYGRMRWDFPAPTVTSRCTSPSCGRFIHPEQDRAITIREAARLQSFRDTFVFPKYTERAEEQVGNAVPPLLIRELVEHFFQENEHVIWR